MTDLEDILRDILPDDEVDELLRLFQLEKENLEKQLREHLSNEEVEEEMRAFQLEMSKEIIEDALRNLTPNEICEERRCFLSEKDNLEEQLRELLPGERVDKIMRAFQTATEFYEKQIREIPHTTDEEIGEMVRQYQSNLSKEIIDDTLREVEQNENGDGEMRTLLSHMASIEELLRRDLPGEKVDKMMSALVSDMSKEHIEEILREIMREEEVDNHMLSFPSDMAKLEKLFRELMPDESEEEVKEAMCSFLSGILQGIIANREGFRIQNQKNKSIEVVLRELMPDEEVDEAIRSGNILTLDEIVKNVKRPAPRRSDEPIQLRTPLRFYKFLKGSFAEETNLGNGAQGAVYKRRHEVFGNVAVKEFRKHPSQVFTEEQREFLIASRMISHRAIVAFYGYMYDSPDGPPTGYVMECLDTSLDKVIFREEGSSLPDITRYDAYGIIFKIAAGLEYMHRDRLIHRDVKPDNILISLDLENVKLCDYGTSRLQCHCPWKEHDSDCSLSKVVDGRHETVRKGDGCGWITESVCETLHADPDIQDCLKMEPECFRNLFPRKVDDEQDETIGRGEGDIEWVHIHHGLEFDLKPEAECFTTRFPRRSELLNKAESAEGEAEEATDYADENEEKEKEEGMEEHLDQEQEEGRVTIYKELETAEEPRLTDGVGTLNYMAPEVMGIEDYDALYTEKCDVYSFAITAWEVLHKRAAYTGNAFKIANRVLNGERPSLEDMTIDTTVRSLLERSWHPDPRERPLMIAIKTDLEKIYTEERLPYFVPDYEKRRTAVGSFNTVFSIDAYKQFCAKFGPVETEQLTLVYQLSAHPNLVTLYDFTYNLRTYTGYTMEYLPLSLDKVIYKNADDNSLPEYSMEEAVEMIRKICRGLIYLHQQGVLHRNVKPSNVLLSRNLQTVKLSDYGIWTTQLALRDQQYHAPELLRQCACGKCLRMQFKDANYGEKCDMYSAALTFWELFHRRSPILDKTNEEFEAMSPLEELIGFRILCKVLGERKRPPLDDSQLNLKWKKLLEKAWHNNPDKRPTILEFARSIDDCVAEA